MLSFLGISIIISYATRSFCDMCYGSIGCICLNDNTTVSCYARNSASIPNFLNRNKIVEVNFAGNSLTMVRNNSFKGLKSLKTLNLDHNIIYDIEPMAFKGLNSVSTLSFRFNRIKSLAVLRKLGNGFEANTNVSIDLSYNKLECDDCDLVTTIDTIVARSKSQLKFNFTCIKNASDVYDVDIISYCQKKTLFNSVVGFVDSVSTINKVLFILTLVLSFVIIIALILLVTHKIKEKRNNGFATNAGSAYKSNNEPLTLPNYEKVFVVNNGRNLSNDVFMSDVEDVNEEQTLRLTFNSNHMPDNGFFKQTCV